jgi:hypothetical protein
MPNRQRDQRENSLPFHEALPEPRYTLARAVTVFFGGNLTKRTLRREFRRHGVMLERLGGKDFCTASDVAALRAAARNVNALPRLELAPADVQTGRDA